MKRTHSVLVLALAVATPAAHAHFVWAILDPSTKRLQLEFSESPGDSVLPNFAGVAEKVSAWSVPGRPLRLTPNGKFVQASVPASVAGAALEYGVMDRSKEGRGVFLLRYFAKATDGIAAAGRRVGLSTEITAHSVHGHLEITVSQDGKPAYPAEVLAHLPGRKEPFEAKTAKDGTVELPVCPAGLIAIRAMVPVVKVGEVAGKRYELIRNYSTLTFAALPNPEADPTAYAMLERATLARQTYPADVEGVEGRINFKSNGREYAGKFVFGADDTVQLEMAGLDDERARSVQRHVASLLGHRRASDFASADGRNPLTFSGPDSLLGRRIALHDRMKSAYRIRGDEITEVDRTIAGDRFIVTLLENFRTDEGKLLSKHFVVNHYDERSGALTKSETYTDAFERIDGVWLPVSRRVVTAEAGSLRVHETTFSNLRVIRRTKPK